MKRRVGITRRRAGRQQPEMTGWSIRFPPRPPPPRSLLLMNVSLAHPPHPSIEVSTTRLSTSSTAPSRFWARVPSVHVHLPHRFSTFTGAGSGAGGRSSIDTTPDAAYPDHMHGHPYTLERVSWHSERWDPLPPLPPPTRAADHSSTPSSVRTLPYVCDGIRPL